MARRFMVCPKTAIPLPWCVAPRLFLKCCLPTMRPWCPWPLAKRWLGRCRRAPSRPFVPALPSVQRGLPFLFLSLLFAVVAPAPYLALQHKVQGQITARQARLVVVLGSLFFPARLGVLFPPRGPSHAPGFLCHADDRPGLRFGLGWPYFSLLFFLLFCLVQAVVGFCRFLLSPPNARAVVRANHHSRQHTLASVHRPRPQCLG